MSGLHDPPNEASRRYGGPQRAPAGQDAVGPDDKAVDAYLEFHFGVKPPEAPAARPQAPSEDEDFETYMRTHFPQTGP